MLFEALREAKRRIEARSRSSCLAGRELETRRTEGQIEQNAGDDDMRI